jgi:hypothetical protein
MRNECFRWGDLRERDHLEDIGVGVIILKWIYEWRGMAWIDVVQDRDMWRALVMQ